LLWAAVLFLIPQCLGGLALDSSGLALRFPTAGRLLAVLDGGHRQPDIVFLGSSRFGFGIHAPEISRILRRHQPVDKPVMVFNASLEAGDPIAEHFMLGQLLARDIRPDLILIEVSPETVNRHIIWMRDHVRRQLGWLEMPAFVTDMWESRTVLHFLAARFLPLFVHRQVIVQRAGQVGRDFLGCNQQPTPALGAGSRVSPWYRMLGMPPITDHHCPERTTIGAGLFQKWLRNYEIGGNAARALEDLLCQCRQLGIHAILIGVPVTELHRGLYTPEINFAFLHYIKRLCVLYQCQFVDYRAAVPDRYFSDNHHLHVEGCIYFSRKLAEEVVAPAWRLAHGDPKQRLVVSREES
jgi:hypothetical protein